MGSTESSPQQEAGPAEEGGSAGSKGAPVSDKVVRVDEVIARKGAGIPVAGRYSSTRVLAQDYRVEAKVVGSGMSGPVQLATGKSDGRKYAVKSFRKRGLSTRKRNELKSEVEIYLSLDHPHIARLEMVYETDEEIHLVMEFMAGGELYDRLSQRKQYSEEAAAETTYQMLLAVAYLHANSIAHRDLKLENFLYERKDTNHLKLIDFGFAKFWDRSTKMSQACGSVHYVAPEVLMHSYTEKADLWSIGVIVYMLLTGSPPFHGSDDEVLRKIKSGSPHFGSRFVRLSEPARDFVQSLLILDPVKRLSAELALDHTWVKTKNNSSETVLDLSTLESLRNFAHASHFRRAVLSMMAWSLSTEDRVELRTMFLSLDKENKGVVTHSQMKKLLEEHFHVDSMEAEALFNSLDSNNDNEIEYTEFMAAALQGRVKVHEATIRKTFQRFDVDECGLISVDDLRSVIGDSFEGADIEELVREADTSGDGKIDYEEFLAYFHKLDEDVEETSPVVPRVSGGQAPGSCGDQCVNGLRLLAIRQQPQESPVAQSPMSRRSTHTEKLGIVLDHLLSNEDQAAAAGAPGAAEPQPAGSPKTPKTPQPLSRRCCKTTS